jgi:hypothetical protein
MSEAETETEYESPFTGKSLSEIALMYIAAKNSLEALKEDTAIAQKWFDSIRHHGLVDKMEELGATSTNLKGIGRVTVVPDMYAGIFKGMNVQAYQWLTEQGHGDLIKDFIHSSTMKAFIKEQFAEQNKEGFNGERLPEEFFRIDPFMRASITKIAK